MTRKEAKKILPIVTAYAEGKTIQVRDSDCGWRDATDDIVSGYLVMKPNDYRIKPEPTYRPFKDGTECWEEMQKHEPFGWVKAIPNKEYKAKYYPNSKDDADLYYQVQKVATGYIKYDDANDRCEIGEQDKSYEDVFKVMTFADGTPFGMEEE